MNNRYSKIITSLLSSIFLCAAILVGSSAYGAPSLKKTNDFIDQMLDEAGSLPSKGSDLEMVIASGCTIDLEFSDPRKKHKEKNYEWNWGNIRSIGGGTPTRVIEIYGYIEYFWLKPNYDSKNGTVSYLKIYVDSSDRADRVIRGMQNAQDLCADAGDMPF